MKKIIFVAMIVLFTIILSNFSNSVSYGKGTSWGPTGWGNSWSNNTWDSSTRWWSDGGYTIQNMYGELNQVQAKIHQDSQNIANKTMNKVMAKYWDGTASWTTLQARDQYQLLLHKLDGLNLNTQTRLQIGDSLDYLKERIQFRVQLLDQQADYERLMEQKQIRLSNNIMVTLETKLKNQSQQYQKEQYQKFLWKIQQKKEMLWNLNLDKTTYQKAQEMLEYMKIKTYGKIEMLDN